MSEPSKADLTVAYNPGHRLYQIVEAALAKESETIFSYRQTMGYTAKPALYPITLWATVLGIPAALDSLEHEWKTVRAVVRGVLDVSDLIDEVELIMELDHEWAETLNVLPTLAKLRRIVLQHLSGMAGLVPGARDHEAASPAQTLDRLSSLIDDNDRRALQICDHHMRRAHRGDLSVLNLNRLLELTSRVGEEIGASEEVEDNLREFMESSIAALQDALAEVPDRGTDPVQIVVNNVIGQSVLRPDLRDNLGRSTVGRRFLQVIAAIGLAVASGITEAATQAVLESHVVDGLIRALTSGA